MRKKENYCFIDGQNLYFGLKKLQWQLDYKRFRVFLKDKYKVVKAYYYFGFIDESYQDLYENLQEAGFIIKFRNHNRKMISNKKGNVDTEIIFETMKLIMELEQKEKNSKIVLVSGDGDYFKLVDFLIQNNRFEKLIYPSIKNLSSLYNKTDDKYKIKIEDLRNRVKRKKGGGSPVPKH